MDKDWLEATWTKEVTTINEVEKDGEVVQEDSVVTEQVHCESFSGHREHIQMLRAKALELGTNLDEYDYLIKECEDSFIYPTEEEIAEELIKQEEYRVQSIKLTTQSLILSKYSLEKQSSANLGIYGELYLTEMKDYISNIIRISNEAEINGTELEDIIWE